IWEGPKPVIGRINGHTFGGGVGLAAACDITIAADSAVFAFSEVRVGVIPAIISVLCVPKLGIQNAMWLFLTGERFSAARAVEVGLVHRAVPAAELDAAVEEVSGLVRLGGPNAVREAKQLVRRIPRLSLDDGFRWTAAKSGELFRSEDAAEVEQLATRFGVRARIAHVEGDDLLPHLADLQARGVDLRHLDQGTPLAALDRQVVTANAYLGAWGIVEALGRGADVVICPRV